MKNNDVGWKIIGGIEWNALVRNANCDDFVFYCIGYTVRKGHSSFHPGRELILTLDDRMNNRVSGRPRNSTRLHEIVDELNNGVIFRSSLESE